MKKLLIVSLCTISFSAWASAPTCSSLYAICAEQIPSKPCKVTVEIDGTQEAFTLDLGDGNGSVQYKNHSLKDYRFDTSKGLNIREVFCITDAIKLFDEQHQTNYLRGKKTSIWLVSKSAVQLANIVDHEIMSKLPKSPEKK